MKRAEANMRSKEWFQLSSVKINLTESKISNREISYEDEMKESHLFLSLNRGIISYE